LEETVAASVWKAENSAVGIRYADHVAPSIRKKLALTSLTSGGRSVGIGRLLTKAMEFFFLVFHLQSSSGASSWNASCECRGFWT
jgi:hypothetical protein